MVVNLSPSLFNNDSNANEFIVNNAGELTNTGVNNGYGVRPISSPNCKKQKRGLIYIVVKCMSPSNFNNNSNANEFIVTSTGELNGWNNVSNGYGVRPISSPNCKNKKRG